MTSPFAPTRAGTGRSMIVTRNVPPVRPAAGLALPVSPGKTR